MKAGVIGVGAAVVWSEPTLKGLARRPAYASSGSQPITIDHTITVRRTNVPDSMTILSGDSGSFGPGEPTFTLQVGAATVIDIVDATGQITYDSVVSDPGGVLTDPPFRAQNRRLRFTIIDDTNDGDFTVIVTMVCEPL